MSHIHLPDGVIPISWWIVGYLIVLLIVFAVIKRLDMEKLRFKIPVVATMAAVMLITMSVPLGFIPFHMNFAALAGMLIGPGLGFVAVFVVNLILALLGHGGITVVGLNTLIIGAEAVVGGAAFRILKERLGGGASAAISTVVALLLSTSLMILFLSSIGVVNIWSEEGLFHWEHKHCEHRHGEHEHVENGPDMHGDDEAHDEEKAVYNLGRMVLTGWSAVLAVLVVGILLESIVTALVIKFFIKVRPDMVNRISEKN